MKKPKKTAAKKRLPEATLLRDEIGSLKRERMDLRDKVADLGAQNEELRKSRRITPAQEGEFVDLRRSFEGMKAEIDKLAIWLRANKGQEIAQGLHNGQTVAETIIGYLESGGIMHQDVKCPYCEKDFKVS